MSKFRINHHYKLNEEIVKVIKRDVWKPDTENKPYIRVRVVHVSEEGLKKPFASHVGKEFDLLVTTQFYENDKHLGEVAYPIAGTPWPWLKSGEKTRNPQTKEKTVVA